MHERLPVEQEYFCDDIYFEIRSFCVFGTSKIRKKKHFSKKNGFVFNGKNNQE
jgi:hypothetical protein